MEFAKPRPSESRSSDLQVKIFREAQRQIGVAIGSGKSIPVSYLQENGLLEFWNQAMRKAHAEVPEHAQGKMRAVILGINAQKNFEAIGRELYGDMLG